VESIRRDREPNALMYGGDSLGELTVEGRVGAFEFEQRLLGDREEEGHRSEQVGVAQIRDVAAGDAAKR
jgi:hypothetical protein